MTTKESIYAEIDSLSDEDLDELYHIIRQFVQAKQQAHQPSLMERLQQIKIDAPADFAANLDLYLSGEKRADSDIR